MGERTSDGMENLSLQTKTRFPGNFLPRFMAGTTASAGAPRLSGVKADPGEGPDPDEVELNLGLSLGGRFGVDKSNNKLIRSSSIATMLTVAKKDDDVSVEEKTGREGCYSGLVRASSLPVETEDEWRKRKELQSLRRLAAKRRRSTKQRSMTKGERDEYAAAMGRVGSSTVPPYGSGKWVSGDGAGKQAAVGGGGESTQKMELKGSSDGDGGQGCSSNMSSLQSTQEGSSSHTAAAGGSSSRSRETENSGRNRLSSMADMPCVFTLGDGPNGRRVDGILYKYCRGEQVKIMCVCHGIFLSPADFVKHAGGPDTLHPLKHIVVNPSSYL